MKKLDWFIIKSYIVPFIITFFIAEFVLVMQVLFVYLDDLVGKGLGAGVFLEFMFLVFIRVVPMALPLAVLLSSIMAMGNFGERSELTAMKAAGVSIFRVMRPLIVVMVFIAGVSFIFSNYMWGRAFIQERILMTDIQNTKLSLVLKEGVFFNEIDNFSIRANKVDKETNQLYDVLIFEHTPTFRYRKIVRAEEGKMGKSDDGNDILLTLYNGQITEVINPTANPYEEKSIIPEQQIDFEETTLKIDISSLGLNRTKEEDYAAQPQLLPMEKLSDVIDSLKQDYDTIKNTLVNYYDNSHLVTRVEQKYSMDTIKLVDFDFKSLPLQDQKNIVHNAQNKISNSISYLESREDDFRNKGKYLSNVTVEWHRKLTLSLACIILFFIGAPLGAIVKKGGFGIPIAIAIVMFLIYYIISITGERLAASLVIPSYIGMWLSSIVLFPLGVILTYQAVTESKVMDFEAWGNWFRKNFRIKKKTDISIDSDFLEKNDVDLLRKKFIKTLLYLTVLSFLIILVTILFKVKLIYIINYALGAYSCLLYQKFYFKVGNKTKALTYWSFWSAFILIDTLFVGGLFVFFFILAFYFFKEKMKEDQEYFYNNER